jgi:cell division protein FtsZ
LSIKSLIDTKGKAEFLTKFLHRPKKYIKEMETTYEITPFSSENSIIKVIGVGGGGSNAVNHMYRQGIKGVEFFVCNTDQQALRQSPIPESNKIILGSQLTAGLGAGSNPEKGRNAAMESKEELRKLLSKNTKMVFVTAGMGGGTGTGAAPVIAEVAKALGILTVGIVTMPFSMEGLGKEKRATEGLEELKKHCDTVLVILNNRLRELYPKAIFKEAFANADNVLATGARAIAELITKESYMNVDFEDVKTAMTNSGTAVMGIAFAEGEGRAQKAAEAALNSPLLNNTNIKGAKYALLHIASDEQEFTMEEYNEISEYIQERTGIGCELKIGIAFEESMGRKIGVTVIVTGFDGVEEKPVYQKQIIDLESNKKQTVPKYTITVDNVDFFEKSLEKAEETLPPVVEKPKQPERIVYSLDGEYDGNEETEEEKKKRKQEEEYRIRQAQLAKMKSVSQLSNEELKEKQDVPAYLRKGMNLSNTPPASEPQHSKLSVNENNRLTNNRFFHDNVD